jgi:hypothetical protein
VCAHDAVRILLSFDPLRHVATADERCTVPPVPVRDPRLHTDVCERHGAWCAQTSDVTSQPVAHARAAR